MLTLWKVGANGLSDDDMTYEDVVTGVTIQSKDADESSGVSGSYIASGWHLHLHGLFGVQPVETLVRAVVKVNAPAGKTSDGTDTADDGFELWKKEVVR